jgi:hypothetical protein
MPIDTFSLDKTNPIFEDELKAITSKRSKLNQDTENVRENLFGIALSGGGVRSATINLGFLKVMNRLDLLKKADYLSSVSGGGYAGSYIHEKLRMNQAGTKNPYSTLFSKGDIDHLRRHGKYLTPPSENKCLKYTTLIGGYLVTGVLHLIWYVLFALFIVYFMKLIPDIPDYLSTLVWILLAATSFYYYFFHFLHVMKKPGIKYWSCKKLIMAEGIFASAILIMSAFHAADMLPSIWNASTAMHVLFLFLLTIIFGVFANPNILSSHMFYRFRLKDAYLWFGKSSRKVYDLNPGSSAEEWGSAPYPLINTTLNLMGKDDYQGLKTCDYFLFSPLYSGSKLTGYIPTNKSEYKNMTLSTAMAVSGAAINSNMGYKSNQVLAFFMTLLNIRLGYWVLNPRVFAKDFTKNYWPIFMKCYKEAYSFAERYNYWPTFWPYCNLSELFGLSNLKRWRVNLSDGGHIENLGVFELLRRRCKLILSVDASADPEYGFSDLKNLIIRARNELGLSIEFRADPQEQIKPKASSGFSKKQYGVADVYDLPKNKNGSKRHVGIFVYIKSSLTPPQYSHQDNPMSSSYKYKTYHPTFPHESTGDQFFDETQWETYYRLGKNMGFSLLSDIKRNIQATAETMKATPSATGKMADYELFDLFNVLARRTQTKTGGRC